MRTKGLAVLVDVVLVLVFVAIGRRSHAESSALAGLATTAWPFLAGLALGWFLAQAWRNPTALWPQGVIVWLDTVVIGMALRALTGTGIAFTFVLVALVSLGVFLLGWRALGRLLVVMKRERRGIRSDNVVQ